MRSDYARADNFLNYSLAPALLAWDQTVPALNQSCISTLSNSCLEALKATDKELKHVLSVIDHGTIPPCISVGMDKLKIDLSGMESGLTLGLSGFQQNRKNLLTEGITRFFSLGMAVPADVKSLDQAQKTQCNTQLVGP